MKTTLMDCSAYTLEFLDVLRKLDHDDQKQAMDRYKERLAVYVKNIPTVVLETLQLENEQERIAAYPVILGALFFEKRFDRIEEIVRNELSSYLVGSTRAYDYFVGVIIRFFYLSGAEFHRDSTMLFSLLVTNRKLGNEYTTAVIMNCLLDMLIRDKIFQRIEGKVSDTSEQALFDYYHGVICMVEGEYESALEHFHTTFMLSNNRNLTLAAEKRVTLCMLLLGRHDESYPYKSKLRTYFELASAVKKASLEEFEEVLKRNKEELLSQGLYFVARRLAQNVIYEGIRKISFVYSRISLEDISHILCIDDEEARYLLHKTIKKGFVKGKIVDGVFHSLKDQKHVPDIGTSIRECICFTKSIQEQMRYPKVEPLCYKKEVEVTEK